MIPDTRIAPLAVREGSCFKFAGIIVRIPHWHTIVLEGGFDRHDRSCLDRHGRGPPPLGAALRRRGSERANRSTTHLVERDSHGASSMSTTTRPGFVRMQMEPSGTVMTLSIVTAHPPEWIRNLEQDD